MKRILTIISIIVVLALVVLTVGWLRSRNTAQKNGTTPLTFKEFVTGTATPKPADSQTPGSISSDFTNPEGQGTTGTQDTGGAPSITPNTSTFTNNGFTPSEQEGARGSGANDTPIGGTPAAGSPGTVVPVPPGTVAPVAVCTDADLNIEFNAVELQKLQALQDRFYEIATSLHNDGDIQTQLANYNALKSKLDRYRELTTYCVNKLAPKIATLRVQDFVSGVSATGDIGGLYDDGSGHQGNGVSMNIKDAYRNKVPTPFWFSLGDIRMNPRPKNLASIAMFLQNIDQFNAVNDLSLQLQTIDQIRQQQAAGSTSATLTADQILLEQQVQTAIQSGLLGVDGIPTGYLSEIGQIAGNVHACQGYDCPKIFRRTMEAFLRLNLW